MKKLVVWLSDEVMTELQRRKEETGAPLGTQARLLITRALSAEMIAPKRRKDDAQETAPVEVHQLPKANPKCIYCGATDFASIRAFDKHTAAHINSKDEHYKARKAKEDAAQEPKEKSA